MVSILPWKMEPEKKGSCLHAAGERAKSTIDDMLPNKQKCKSKKNKTALNVPQEMGHADKGQPFPKKPCLESSFTAQSESSSVSLNEQMMLHFFFILTFSHLS